MGLGLTSDNSAGWQRNTTERTKSASSSRTMRCRSCLLLFKSKSEAQKTSVLGQLHNQTHASDASCQITRRNHIYSLMTIYKAMLYPCQPIRIAPPNAQHSKPRRVVQTNHIDLIVVHRLFMMGSQGNPKHNNYKEILKDAHQDDLARERGR